MYSVYAYLIRAQPKMAAFRSFQFFSIQASVTFLFLI